MPPDAAKTREDILHSAEIEFLQFGFAGASLRKIAAGAGVTTGALYRHFADKEALFDALVAPCFEGFMSIFENAGEKFIQNPEENAIETMWPSSENNLITLVGFMYDNLDSFRLLLSASEQTAYENFIHNLINREVQMTLEYLAVLIKKGIKVNTVSPQELHMFVTAQFSVFFEMILHNIPKDKAMKYTENIFRFFAAGWREMFIG